MKISKKEKCEHLQQRSMDQCGENILVMNLTPLILLTTFDFFLSLNYLKFKLYKKKAQGNMCKNNKWFILTKKRVSQSLLELFNKSGS